MDGFVAQLEKAGAL